MQLSYARILRIIKNDDMCKDTPDRLSLNGDIPAAVAYYT